MTHHTTPKLTGVDRVMALRAGLDEYGRKYNHKDNEAAAAEAARNVDPDDPVKPSFQDDDSGDDE